jgi:hypothetical protein
MPELLKFSVFTRTLASVLKVTPADLADHFVVGHTEKLAEEANIKIPLADLLEAAGASLAFASQESDASVMPETIGGLQAGTTAATLKQMTLSEVLDAMLFAVVNPTMMAKSFVFNSLGISSVQEIGSTQAVNLVSVFNQGLITNGDGTSGPLLVGAASLFSFTGPGITGTLSQNSGDAGAGTVAVNFDVTLGSQRWTGSVNHAGGSGGYTNSKGQPSVIFDAQRAVGSITVNSSAITGIYPILYGSDASELASGTAYAALTKLIEAKATKSLTLNASGEYVYFAFPSSYGDLASIKDGNGFTVTSSFSKTSVTINSTGLGSDWSVGYSVYRTNAPTTINAQTYQFTWL